MKEMNAVELRQALGKVGRALERDGQPILLKVGRRPVGVIISVRDFRERFALKAAEEERRRVVERIRALRRRSELPVQKVIDDLRGR